MMNQSDYVSAIVRLAGGEIIGKTRLQKIAYLLQAKGSGFSEVDFGASCKTAEASGFSA